MKLPTMMTAALAAVLALPVAAHAKDCTKVSGPIDKGGALLLGQDTSALSLLTGEFTTTVHIVGGTHQYKRGSGTIVAVGVFDLATGATAGTYSGTVCKKSEDDADGVD